MKKDKKVAYTVLGVLCVFNLPLILYLVVENYQTFRLICIIVYIVVNHFFLVFFINKIFFVYNFKRMDNGQKIYFFKNGKFISKVQYTVYVVMYYIFVINIFIDGYYDIMWSILFYSCLLNMYAAFLGRSFLDFYYSDNYLFYSDRLIEKDNIVDYDINTMKKGKKGTKDKIKLKIHSMYMSIYYRIPYRVKTPLYSISWYYKYYNYLHYIYEKMNSGKIYLILYFKCKGRKTFTLFLLYEYHR